MILSDSLESQLSWLNLQLKQNRNMFIIIFLVFLASFIKSFKLETNVHVPFFLGCTVIEVFLGVVKEYFFFEVIEYVWLGYILQIRMLNKISLFLFQIMIVKISYNLNFIRFKFFLKFF